MSFRRRITLVAAAAVAIAVVLASLLTYVLTSDQLHGQVDSQLRNRGHAAGRLLRFLNADEKPAPVVGGNERIGLAPRRPAPPSKGLDHKDPGRTRSGADAGASSLFGNLQTTPTIARGYQQVVLSSGTILVRSDPNVSLPVDAATLRLAKNGGRSFFRDARVQGIHLRVLAEPFGRGRAIQLAQPLTEVDSLLSRLRLILVLLDIGGIAVAALLGRLVTGASVRPLKRLNQATEHIALTQDLSRRIESVGEDEAGRLAKNFNAMLDALERSMKALDASVQAQRQLVADASHELRTPVTSLRTNIEMLQQDENMEVHERRRLLSAVVEQIGELTLLMNDLIDLAREEEPDANAEDTRLDLLLSDAVERARTRAPATPLLVELQPTIVTGVAPRLERAVSNLIDNAVKYSPPGESVEIKLRGEMLTVRDHGPGISSADLPHIFDRFYRGAEARGRPGSGLGLAIVRQAVGQHGGSVTAEAAPGGGTLVRMRLPGAETIISDPSELTAGALSGAGTD